MSWDVLPEVQRAYAAARIHLIEESVPGLLEDSQTILRPGGLERIAAPVTLISGDRSPAIIPAVLTALEARLPETRRATVPGAGHMVPITHPADTARAIRAGL